MKKEEIEGVISTTIGTEHKVFSESSLEGMPHAQPALMGMRITSIKRPSFSF